MLNLKNILVVSIEQAVAAPYCSNRFAQAGARVIKVEREEGDFARAYDNAVHGESAYFIWLNQGKESLVLNIKDTDDALLMHRILGQADVFIQNLAPGATARAGFGSDDLHKLYPKLICCDISGYGESGDYRNMKAYDLLVQCESGLASITGTPDAPGRVGVSVCDINCGQQAYSAILEALIEREVSDKGCVIKVSLFDSMAEWLAVPLLHYDYTGRLQERVGISHATICPYGAYTCKDGTDIVFSVQNEREWLMFCRDVLENVSLEADQKVQSNQLRVENRHYVDQLIDKVFSQLAHAQVIERLKRAGIAYGRINDISGLSNHPQTRRITIDTPSGKADIVAPAALHLGKNQELRNVPSIGEHSTLLRKEFS